LPDAPAVTERNRLLNYLRGGHWLLPAGRHELLTVNSRVPTPGKPRTSGVLDLQLLDKGKADVRISGSTIRTSVIFKMNRLSPAFFLKFLA
jgi:hypothetical protein